MAYAYLNVDVRFTHPYYANDYPFTFLGSDGRQTKVASFCSYPPEPDPSSVPVREQVEILHYEYGDAPEAAEFIVDLCRHTQPYQVILAHMPRCATLGQAAQSIQERTELFKKDPDYAVLRRLRLMDTLVVPDVLYKLTHHFEELLGKKLGNERRQGHTIFEALQKIDFSLSRTGVVLRSEARMGTASSSTRGLEPRHLRFDRPFLICVKKREPGARRSSSCGWTTRS